MSIDTPTQTDRPDLMTRIAEQHTNWKVIVPIVAIIALLGITLNKCYGPATKKVQPARSAAASNVRPAAYTAPAAQEAPIPRISPSSVRIQKVHIVRKREHLHRIANLYPKVGWEDILLVNEGYLRAKYEATCSRYSRRVRNTPGRRGTFCNDRYGRPYGNTLLPRWRLNIPAGTTSPAVSSVVARIKGKRIGLVIDDTGSMNDDRQAVSLLYTAALRQQGKTLIGIWLYAEGKVRFVDPKKESVNYLTEGRRENTHGALIAAAASKPDAIVLVTDETGDDWKWPAPGTKMGLPPVFANCLPDGGQYGCESSLRRLVREVGGEYIPYARR